MFNSSPYNQPTGHAPYEKGTIHGDLYHDHNGWHLTYQPVRGTMREQVSRHGRYGLAKNVSGLVVLEVLEYYCDPQSVEMLKSIMMENPGHVVEFTSFEVVWGTTAKHNTVIWEVRNW